MPTEKLINRPEYLEKLIKWSADTSLIKIITGVRRCGKSKLLDLFKIHLLSAGIAESQIHKIDLDMLENERLQDPTALYDHIMSIIDKDKLNYVFLDEIQLVTDWQKVANSLRNKDNIDLYLTGSNAYMFSSKLGTLLGGRYIEIKMQPLSFKEFVDGTHPTEAINANNTISQALNLGAVFAQYTTQSGFPQTLKYNGDTELIDEYLLDSVYRNTISKDIVKRYQLRSPEKLNEVIRFLFDNISRETSITNIEKALGNTVSNDTIDKYINGLLDSYLMYSCERYDLKGKKILTSSPKYYACDVGLRNVVLGRKIGDAGHILENIVYLELIRRGYQVYVGKVGKKMENGEYKNIEVDFIATKGNGIVEYYQVSQSVAEERVLKRELASLTAIKDSYPKYLLTMDFDSGNYNGIKHMNILQWLLEK